MDKQKTLKYQAFSSMIWKFMERIIAQGIALVISIILARILSPDDYGVVSLVTIFFTFADVVISGGLNTALIQKKESDEDDYSTVFWISLIVSIVVYGLLFSLAPCIAKIYNQQILIKIIRIMGLVLPIYAAKSIICAYISATLQFRKFFLATIGGTVLSGIIGILMAYQGFGAWSLVAQQVTNTFIDTVILYISTRFRLCFRISWERFRELFGYGWKIFFSSLINVIYDEVRPLFIGIRFSAADLSFYSKGHSFPNFISSTTTSTLSAVLFPILSRYQNDKDALLRYTRLFVRIASFLLFPMMLGLFAISDNFVCVLLTEKWIEASYYIKIFAIASMFSMINIGNCETIKAMGRSDIYLIMEIIKKIGYFIIIGIYIVTGRSTRELAFSSIICTGVAICVNTFPNRKLIGYNYMDQLFDILPNFVSSALMSFLVVFIGNLSINKISLLVIQVFGGGLFYLGMNYISKNESLIYCIDYLKKLIEKS